jgi:hypothetical protein
MRTICFLASLLFAISGAMAQAPTSPGLLTSVIVNDGTTGTTVRKLAKLTSAGKAILAATTDTDGTIGVVLSGAGTSGSAQLATNGVVSCAFDGTATAGDYVQISSSVAGDCKDTGSSTRPGTGQVIGRVIGGGSGAGSYTLALQISTGSVAVEFYGTLTANQSVTSGVFAKASLTTSIDNLSYWSSPNHNYNPQIAGTYEACFTVSGSATFTTGLDVEGGIGKNGIIGTGTTVVLTFAGAITGTSTSFTAAACSLVSMNGSTDTLELDAAITGGSPFIYGAVGASGAGATSLTVYRVGP